jgi:hypothetical protein
MYRQSNIEIYNPIIAGSQKNRANTKKLIIISKEAYCCHIQSWFILSIYTCKNATV